MAQQALIRQVNDWLAQQALGQPEMVTLFEGLCERLYAIGIPVSRALLSWPTLHPLFRAEAVIWRRGKPTALDQFNYQNTAGDAWTLSPMFFMLERNLKFLRRRLQGPHALLDFPILVDIATEGFTDYLALITEFEHPGVYSDFKRRGFVVTWATERDGGFSDEDAASIQQIQQRLAVACKTVIQARVARTITETYLGKHAGDQVLNGSIRLGDGDVTHCIVWYSDLRASTRLAETLSSADFLKLLNRYFECAARPAIEAGGEVLAFIGDAVLAIFPIDGNTDQRAMAKRVFNGLRKSTAMAETMNAEQAKDGMEPFRFGVGLNIGEVMFGNIGVPERLAFSAIGPTVIEVARIEKLTKTLGYPILATHDVAALAPDVWQTIGNHPLEGVGQPRELFGFRPEAAAAAA